MILFYCCHCLFINAKSYFCALVSREKKIQVDAEIMGILELDISTVHTNDMFVCFFYFGLSLIYAGFVSVSISFSVT